MKHAEPVKDSWRIKKKGTSTMEKEEMKNQILALRAQGLSFAEIAGELKIGEQILLSWAKEFQDEVKERGCGC